MLENAVKCDGQTNGPISDNVKVQFLNAVI